MILLHKKKASVHNIYMIIISNQWFILTVTSSAMLLVLTPPEGTIELELCKPVHFHTLVTAGETNHVTLYTISYSDRCLVKY